MVGLPFRPGGSPALSGGTIGGRGPRSRPGAVCLHDVESTQLADPFVPLLDLAADVPRAAADFPLVHARVAAEGPARRFDRRTAPAADRISGLVSLGLSPLVRGDNARAT